MKLESVYDVVISGIGGHFPKANNIEEFKKGLLSNQNLQGSRWKAGERGVTNVIGTIEGIEHFDASYFGIHREQSNFMDPMQRLVLERTFEALIDAGVNPLDIRGKKIAVYAGSSVGENDNLFYESIVSGFGITGHSRSMMPNRVSYWLNLKGPSCAYDNNWLNGIEVIQAGYDTIRYGHCEAAIVATANLALNSELSWIYNDMGLLSPDGSTKSFDADANGYGRSDGVIVFLLQRKEDAKRSYATILGANSRFNGNREGAFRDLNTDAMANFIREFYDECKVDPKEVEFVECYGSGQKEVDEAELTAIDRVYCKNRQKPLLIGSVKPNTGHAEASAILMSLAKVLVATETGYIPANLNYKTPNPNIEGLVKGRLEVVTKNKKWEGGLMAINGIGLASSYGHILIRANPKVGKAPADNIPRVVCLSTRTEDGIKAILESLKSEETIDPEYVALIHESFKKSIAGHLYRGYAILDQPKEERKSEFEYYPGNKREIWFCYSGMGSQWCKMAVDLMELPIFASAMYECHEILKPKGIDLMKIVTEDDPKIFDNILHSFVGIAAIQIGLTDTLKALGIVPDGIIGHSVGELGCAYADGCFTKEQMIMCAYSRGKASLDATLITGMMAAIGKGYQQMKDECPPTIEVACHNGPDSCTLSGPKEDMEKYVKELQDRNIFARLVNVSNIAYHSRYIKPAAPLLLENLKKVIPEPKARSSKWISTSVPEDKWDTDLAKTCSAEYQTNNLLSSVLFEEGCRHIPKDAIVIEIAPHGLLQAILKRSLKGNCTNIPLTLRSSDNGVKFLLSAIGKMYLAGIDTYLPAIYPTVKYPVSKGVKSLTPLVHWEHGEKWRAGLEDKLNYMASVRDLTISLSNDEYRYLNAHQLNKTTIIPTSTYLAFLYDILTGTRITKISDVIFENLKFKNMVTVPKMGSIPLYVMVQKGSGEFEISSGDQLVGTGVIRTPDSERLFAEMYNIDVDDKAMTLTSKDIYNEFSHRGHTYTNIYKAMLGVTMSEEGSIGKIKWNNSWSQFMEGMLQQFLLKSGEKDQSIHRVSTIQRIVMSIPLLPTEPTELEVVYDYYTKVISTEGIQICGVTSRAIEIENKAVTFDSIDLTPLTNVEYKNIESGINLSFQLVLENFVDRHVSNIMIVEVETKNGTFEQNIKNVTSQHTHISANISSVTDAKMVLISQTDPMLVIINDKVNEDCVKLVTSSHAFLLARTGGSNMTSADLVEVAQFSVLGESYSLLRKSAKVDASIITVDSASLSSTDLQRDDQRWVTEFKSALAAKSSENKRVYLTCSVLPFEGISNFVSAVKGLPNMKNARFVFVMDKKMPPFSVKEAIYQHVFREDLLLVVAKNGTTYTYVSVPTAFKDDIKNPPPTISNIVENTRIDYLGLNVYDETLFLEGEPKAELGNIDYSGVNSAGEEVMGLARFDTEFSKLVFDPILKWNIPSVWTIQDGATIPHAYTMAYYVLHTLARTQPSETVLIHNGCSPLGYAAISIASAIGCTVFTTVTSDVQKAYLRRQYKFLIDRNVLNGMNTSFEPHLLMATGGVGAHVIINCYTGSMLSATLRCVAEFGRIYHMGKIDCEDNNEIGMSIFLKNVSITGVCAEEIFDEPDDVKEEVRAHVTKGLEDLVVRPIKREIVEHQDIASSLRKLKDVEYNGKIVIKLQDNLAIGQFNISKTDQYMCNPSGSYLIYGGSSEMYTDLLEWLVFRGARKIVLATNGRTPEDMHLHRRISLLQSSFNATIVFSKKNAKNKDEVAGLLSEMYSLGEIQAVFTLPRVKAGESAVNAILNLESCLKSMAPKTQFINFVEDAAGICELRVNAGFPSHNIAWENLLKFPDVLKSLDLILTFKARNILIKSDRLKDVIQENSQSLYKKLNLLLPHSISEMKAETCTAPEGIEFEQYPSLCGRVIRDSPPVFMFPGLFQRRAAVELSLLLLHPVFCVNYPNSIIPVSEAAQTLALRIKQIYPRGPYNIIGISYGGPFAIEVAKCLERHNCRVKLHLVDGAPDTIQGILKHLGEGSNNEIGLLCRVLNLTNPDIVKSLSTLSGWQLRLKYALKHYECSEEDKEYLSETLSTFKKYVNAILAYQPSDDLLVGPISILRPSGASQYDVCGITKYCQQNPEVTVVDGNHATMLKERSTAKGINSKAYVR
ncbi:hypothetical protein PPYR_04585 [Photinus pyralis]|uniref:Ketosynthase family 3 (KS3) domain-containing protein n=2 Tax=Photinus pyralis TaxID=7054 RepID=A0A5N4AYI7_PHOPY|nr:fatty acid synthase-like [Photinus pyralis]KAB0802399.1 hypothetical protein PPYR_04585 [Photinus pyralis]